MQYPIHRPDIVDQALSLAQELGFPVRPEGNRPETAASASCCIDAVGALLRALCSSLADARVAEIGTGAGVGTAWLASGLRESSTLTTVEIDPDLHTATSRVFSGHKNVEVLLGDWRADFKQRGPFDLLFADGGGVGDARKEAWEEIAGLVHGGGIIVIDDLTPEPLWPDSWRGKPDPKREFAFNSGHFTSTEILTGASTSALLMVRQ